MASSLGTALVNRRAAVQLCRELVAARRRQPALKADSALSTISMVHYFGKVSIGLRGLGWAEP
jgi:hypothetical protein